MELKALKPKPSYVPVSKSLVPRCLLHTAAVTTSDNEAVYIFNQRCKVLICLIYKSRHWILLWYDAADDIATFQQAMPIIQNHNLSILAVSLQLECRAAGGVACQSSSVTGARRRSTGASSSSDSTTLVASHYGTLPHHRVAQADHRDRCCRCRNVRPPDPNGSSNV